MVYYFLYKTTNTVNGKYYVGVHQTLNLDDGYLGSGVALTRAIKKYGSQRFVREIVQFFDTRDDMFAAEVSLITEQMLNDPLCYNIACGGQGGSMPQNQKPHTIQHTEEVKQQISATLKRHYAQRAGTFAGRSHTQKTKVLIGEVMKRINTNKPKSLEHRNKISSSLCNTYELTSPSHTIEKIDNLKAWCAARGLDYNKVVTYIDKGPIKMIERYRTPTREWFEGYSLKRV